MSIFAVPKHFRGQAAIHQINAITSWKKLGSTVEVILIGDDDGVADTANLLEVHHIKSVDKNEHDTPLLDSVFRLGRSESSGLILAYVNSDIVLLPDFLNAVHDVRLERFLLCGRRFDCDKNDYIDFADESWPKLLTHQALHSGRLHDKYGIDYFVFSRDVFQSIPPFAIGRHTWDNWLIYKAHMDGVPVIDASKRILAIHQNHGYEHVSGGFEEAKLGVEAERNRKLAAGMGDDLYTVDDATWSLDRSGPKLKWRYRHQRLFALWESARRWLLPTSWAIGDGWHRIGNSVKRLRGRPAATITAEHRRLVARGGSRNARAAIRWTASGTEQVEIRVNSPDGPLLARSGPVGEATTGDWVEDGMAFYLCDASPESAGRGPAVLATVSFLVDRATSEARGAKGSHHQ